MRRSRILIRVPAASASRSNIAAHPRPDGTVVSPRNCPGDSIIGIPSRVFSTAYRCTALYASIIISGLTSPLLQFLPEYQSARKKLPRPHPGNLAYSSSSSFVGCTLPSRIS